MYAKRTEQTSSLIYDIFHYLWKEAQGNYGFNILIIYVRHILML